MSDPERLLTSSNADPAVVELLESLRTVAPGPSVSLSTWPAMAAKVATLPVTIAPPSAAPVAPPPSALGGVAKVLALKWLGVAAATSAGLAAGALWLRRPAPAPLPARVIASSAVIRPAPPSPAPQAPEDSASPAPEPAPEKPSAPGVAATSRSSRLDAEASLLAKVRGALRRGDPRGAQIALSQLQSSFPSGGLMQEREVLTVEVLAANGNLTLAQRRASAFIAAHPTSPYSAKLQRFVPAPE